MSDSTASSPPVAPESGNGITPRRAVSPDKLRAKLVILEILRQAQSASKDSATVPGTALANIFWFAHLYYAKGNPGYLTDWPIVRAPLGADISDVAILLGDLLREGFVEVKQAEIGPFPLMAYACTGKMFSTDLPPAGVLAIQQALQDVLYRSPPMNWSWPGVQSRTWLATPDGEEMDVYLDLIPVDVYEERRKMLEALKEGCGDLFS